MLRVNSVATGKLSNLTLHMALIALIALTATIAFRCPQVMIQSWAFSALPCKRAAAEMKIACRGITFSAFDSPVLTAMAAGKCSMSLVRGFGMSTGYTLRGWREGRCKVRREVRCEIKHELRRNIRRGSRREGRRELRPEHRHKDR